MYDISATYSNYTKSLEKFDLRAAYGSVITLIDLANRYFDDEKPWTIKDDPEKLRNIMLNLVEILYHITILVAPFLPDTAAKMREIFVDITTKIEGDRFVIDTGFRVCGANAMMKLQTIPLLFEKKI